MHLKRWLTGIILAIILVVPLFIRPKWPFHLVLAVISAAAMMETFRLFDTSPPFALRILAYLFGCSLFGAIFLGAIQYWPLIVMAWTLLPMIGALFFLDRDKPNMYAHITKTIFVPCYIAFPLSMLALIFRYPRGNLWVLFLFVVVFAGDTGAFYFGRLMGNHRLMPSVSPGKTWEGALGGAICTVLAGLWYLHIVKIGKIGIPATLLLVAIAIVAQLGDLAESLLKRTQGKKDSGSLLPGHGGILDRIDGLLFAIPILYLYLLNVTI